MRRRDLVALVALTIGAPSAPHALARDKLWHIGFLDLNLPPTPERPSYNLRFFKGGLSDLGYEEGRDYVIEARFGDTDVSRLPTLAKELVDLGVDVIVTIGSATTRNAIKATTTIPIVMAGAPDPVGNGWITSLAHPGGNVTGLTRFPTGSNFFGKGLQIFKEVDPNVSRIAVLGTSQFLPGIHAAAGELKIVLFEHDTSSVKNASDFNDILAKISDEGADAVFVTGDFVNVKYMSTALDFVSKNRLPSWFEETVWVEGTSSIQWPVKGLLSYFTDILELRRRAAFFVDKIFKGVKPADLPVEEPTRFKLVINLKTAKELGLTVPESVLQIADKVIE